MTHFNSGRDSSTRTASLADRDVDMNSTEEPAKRPRWPVIAAITGPPVIFAALLTTALAGVGSNESDLWVGATDFGPTSEAPAGAVDVIHDALHLIGAQCLKSHPDLRAIASDVDLIVAFSQKYPVGRFPIDDETATASSLLLVTSEAVKGCAPAELDRLQDSLR